jgi:hypothetical protein
VALSHVVGCIPFGLHCKGTDLF